MSDDAGHRGPASSAPMGNTRACWPINPWLAIDRQCLNRSVAGQGHGPRGRARQVPSFHNDFRSRGNSPMPPHGGVPVIEKECPRKSAGRHCRISLSIC